jgi:glycogen debranching enzyme
MTADVTAIAGLSFAVSDGVGDIRTPAHGLFVRDTRHLSGLELLLDGAPMQELGSGSPTPAVARFRGFARPADARGAIDAPLEVERIRRLGENGLREEITLHAWAAAPFTVEVRIRAATDLVDIFQARQFEGGPSAASPLRAAHTAADEIRFTSPDGQLSTTLTFDPPPERVEAGDATWTIRLERNRPWRLTVVVSAEAAHVADGSMPMPIEPAPAPRVTSDPPDLARALQTSMFDFGALTLPDPSSPGRRLVTAGIPWFVALFGRDSLISSYQARAIDPRLMLETLGALAARQGTVLDAGNEEAPGKILHEVRLTPRPWLGVGTAGAGAHPYYGTVDATPLFLMLLGQAWRWGASRESITALLPAAHAALGWLRGPDADPDGDGLIEYHAGSERTLVNQAWKDSANAIQFRDGTLAEGPIAVVEVQGYAVRARREFAAVLAAFGDDAAATDLIVEADALAAQVRERYWISGSAGRPGYFALALDGEKRRVDSVASDMGHLLWCDIPTDARAAEVARHLVSPEMASGWGLRTLSSAMGGFNPISYHLGSVWPHDTHLAIEGLRRYGHDAEAMALADQLIDALVAFDGRLPELFAGHARADAGFPVPYPTACRPQAWAAGVPPALVATFLGIEPDIPGGVIRLAPVLPASLERLAVDGVRFPTGELSVEVSHSEATVTCAPNGVRVEIAERVSPSGRPPILRSDEAR